MKVLSGSEHFLFEGKPQGIQLVQFWAWNSSDLLNNTLRGVLAEFIVASACELDTSKARVEWDAYDLKYNDLRIEVKCSAYLQSWEQKRASSIRFSIAPSQEWSVEKGYFGDSIRRSDVYAFCIFSCVDRQKANPLDLSQWEFYVLPTEVLDEKRGAQKTIGLAALLALEPQKCCFGELKEAIDKIRKAPG